VNNSITVTQALTLAVLAPKHFKTLMERTTMPIFDQIEYAIQEAHWCADHYDEKQVIIKVGDKFGVKPYSDLINADIILEIVTNA
jgi:hypothetical protein